MAQQITTDSSSILNAMMQNTTTIADTSIAEKFNAIYSKSLNSVNNEKLSDSKFNINVDYYSNANEKLDYNTVCYNPSLNESNSTEFQNNSFEKDINSEYMNDSYNQTSLNNKTEETAVSENSDTEDEQTLVLNDNEDKSEIKSDVEVDSQKEEEFDREIDTEREIDFKNDIKNNTEETKLNINIENKDLLLTEENINCTQLADTVVNADISYNELSDDNYILSDSDKDIIPDKDVSVYNNMITDNSIDSVLINNNIPTVNISENLDISDIIADINNSDIKSLIPENIEEINVSDLISNDMLDELNVTLNEISNNSTSENVDLMLMNSSEQAVKYNLEKDTELFKVNTDIVTTLDNEKLQETEILDDLSDNKLSYDIENVELSEVETKDEKTTVTNSSSENLVQESDETSEIITENKSDNEGFQKESSDNNELLSHNTQQEKNLKKKDIKTADNETESDIPEIDTEHTVSKNTLNSQSEVSVKIHTGNENITNHQQGNTFVKNTNISKQEVVSQIYNKLNTLNNTTNSKISMVLNPESLGKVTIQVINTKSGLEAEMVVTSQAVKDILDENLSGLKDTLASQGVNVNNLSVKVNSSENNTEMDYTEQESSQSGRDEKQGKQDKKDNNEFEKMFAENIKKDEQDDN